MPCYKPIQAFRAGEAIFFCEKKASLHGYPVPIKFPCRQCIGCRLRKARETATRCMHEAQLHDHNAFVTLTYDDQHLPNPPTLVKKHLQDFNKRLRHYQQYKFYAVGEYGENTRRPHYHALLFGADFPEKEKLFKSPSGHIIYHSEKLDKIWGHGYTTIANVTFVSCAYCAKYATKKITGGQAEEHYRYTDPTTGEIHQLQPEFSLQSTKPAIGRQWWEQFHDDVRRTDKVIINGKEMQPPEYYDKLFEKTNEEYYKAMKLKRREKIDKKEITKARLETRHKVAQLKLKQKQREKKL